MAEINVPSQDIYVKELLRQSVRGTFGGRGSSSDSYFANVFLLVIATEAAIYHRVSIERFEG